MKSNQMIMACMMAIAFVCVSVPSWACSSAVISGKVTPDGRPLLWKNRETGYLKNHMAYVKGEKYDFVADVNSDNFDKLKDYIIVLYQQERIQVKLVQYLLQHQRMH